MDRPTGITVLGVLYILAGLAWLAIAAFVSALSSSFMGNSMMAGLGVLGGAIAGFAVIGAIIEFVIAGALFSGKSWGRILVIVFAIIDLILNAISILGFNLFALIFIILDIIVLYYMWRPHVIDYFKGRRQSSIFYCKHCKYAASSYRELYNHLLTCEKRNEEKQTKNQNSNLEILKERLAKGEISKEEYKELKSEFE